MSFNQAPSMLLLCLLLLAGPAPASGAQVDGLYAAEVTVEDRSAEAREPALQSAMAAVLVRLTGSTARANSQALSDLIENPNRFVQAYRYGRSGSATRLQVTFDGRALAEAVTRRGVGVWGDQRPKVLVWLAIDYGGGRRLIVPADSDGPVARRIRAAATERGLPVSLPLMDAADRERITFADVWGGFTETLESASRRYAPDAILVGRARRGQGGALRVEWKLHFNSELLATQGGVDAGVQEAADYFARQFVVGGGGTASARMALRIIGVGNLRQYAAILAHLESLSLIESVTLREARDDELLVDVTLRGSRQQLQRALALGRVLKEADSAGATDSVSGDLTLRPVR